MSMLTGTFLCECCEEKVRKVANFQLKPILDSGVQFIVKMIFI